MSDLKSGPTVSKAANAIHFSCGCIAEWQLIGAFASIAEWHIIPCYNHAEKRDEIEKLADVEWERLTSEVTK